MIQTQGLSRVYKSYVKPEGMWNSIRGFWDRQHTERVALKPTTLEIEPGQIVGLVGANGAGKTTLLKLLSGLVHPSSGTATVLGYKPWERDRKYLRQMSILLGQKNQLWWDLAPLDSYSLLADIYDLDPKKAKLRVQELALMLNCEHVLTTQLRRLSLGERMKMEIIASLLHSPRVLFLDEPTIGLDIVAQTSIRNFLETYVKDHGPTVILTSHYMDDIAKLSDRLLLISQGQIVYDGDVAAFTRKTQISQKLSFSLGSPLPDEEILAPGYVVPKGQQEISLQVPEKDIAQVLARAAILPGIENLKLEQTDFEDVIHEFMAKESRIL